MLLFIIQEVIEVLFSSQVVDKKKLKVMNAMFGNF